MITQLHVFLTPSGSEEVEMPLLSAAPLACLLGTALCCPSRGTKQAASSPQDSAFSFSCPFPRLGAVWISNVGFQC